MAQPVRLTDGLPAAMDRRRRRFLLFPDHLAVLGLLSEGATLDEALAPARDALVEAGVVDADGRLDPAAVELSAALAGSSVLVDVETSADDGIVYHGLAFAQVDGAAVCWARSGWPGTAQAEYLPVDVGMVVPWIATTVALGRDGGVGAQHLPAVIETTVGEIEGAQGDVARVVDASRLSWRVTVHGPGRATRALAVTDAGELGLWERTAPAEPFGLDVPDPATRVVLERRAPGDLWRALVGLLERTDEDAAA
ncbi:hypothetical protein CLV28_0525 [Sediminihabitans luteus]|uniref:ESAT-6 protein secretion system EspG family protein n=1 Tax=Sediminihabitans luteus TaxID=1138585 RepID=A0A2M9CZD5_9CELL|nr:hypothetical protein [Sediminihabitans luteus]PJJ77306.1 hypothetical protein CLV28_0525 [Sediminihabitans luteus]GII98757.1 hypothetical protein Slu03_11350 [Sediminihabitans luteus]